MSANPQEPIGSTLTSSLKKTADSLTAVVQPAENELTRWRKTFDKFAGVEIEGKKCVTLKTLGLNV